MTPITVRANEISQPVYVGAGSRITLTGSGYVEWCAARTLQDAANGSLTWSQWPNGTTAGYQDTVRGMAIRVVGTGDCSVTVDSGVSDPFPDGQYWDAQTVTAQTDPLTGGIEKLTAGNAVMYPVLGPFTFSTLPSAALTPGAQVRVSDVGPAGVGSLWVSDGTVWRPENGRCVLVSDGASVAMSGATDTVLKTLALPRGILKNGFRLGIRVSLKKSGTTDTPTIRLRVGANGNIADAALFASTSFAAANLSHGTYIQFRRDSDRLLQKIGSSATLNDAFDGGQTSAPPAAVDIGSTYTMDNSSLYLSLTASMSGATDTLTVFDWHVELLA